MMKRSFSEFSTQRSLPEQKLQLVKVRMQCRIAFNWLREVLIGVYTLARRNAEDFHRCGLHIWRTRYRAVLSSCYRRGRAWYQNTQDCATDTQRLAGGLSSFFVDEMENYNSSPNITHPIIDPHHRTAHQHKESRIGEYAGGSVTGASPSPTPPSPSHPLHRLPPRTLVAGSSQEPRKWR